jgi:hypothetical protein
MTITVKAYNGQAWTFDSIDDAVVKINRSYPIEKLSRGVLSYWVQSNVFGRGFSFGNGDDVVFYDEYDLRIPVWKVKEAFYNLPEEVRETKYYYWRSPKAHAKPEHFRKYSVPYTGVRHWRRGGRRIRTLQQLKAEEALALDEEAIEHNVKPRKKYIPNDRDDHIVYVPRTKNWKKFRKSQWKA